MEIPSDRTPNVVNKDKIIECYIRVYMKKGLELKDEEIRLRVENGFKNYDKKNFMYCITKEPTIVLIYYKGKNILFTELRKNINLGYLKNNYIDGENKKVVEYIYYINNPKEWLNRFEYRKSFDEIYQSTVCIDETEFNLPI